MLYVGLTLKSIQQLQLVQAAVTGILTGVGCRDHISPLLFHFHWLLSCFQIQFKILVFVFKAFYGLGLACFKDSLLLYESAQLLRLSLEALCLEPLSSEARQAATWERAFLMAPTLWNSFLREINLFSFVRETKRHDPCQHSKATSASPSYSLTWNQTEKCSEQRSHLRRTGVIQQLMSIFIFPERGA